MAEKINCVYEPPCIFNELCDDGVIRRVEIPPNHVTSIRVINIDINKWLREPFKSNRLEEMCEIIFNDRKIIVFEPTCTVLKMLGAWMTLASERFQGEFTSTGEYVPVTIPRNYYCLRREKDVQQPPAEPLQTCTGTSEHMQRPFDYFDRCDIIHLQTQINFLDTLVHGNNKTIYQRLSALEKQLSTRKDHEESVK